MPTALGIGVCNPAHLRVKTMGKCHLGRGEVALCHVRQWTTILRGPAFSGTSVNGAGWVPPYSSPPMLHGPLVGCLHWYLYTVP